LTPLAQIPIRPDKYRHAARSQHKPLGGSVFDRHFCPIAIGPGRPDLGTYLGVPNPTTAAGSVQKVPAVFYSGAILGSRTADPLSASPILRLWISIIRPLRH
jgi:hypothetical protein